jgi:hypothetical protein
MGIRPLEEFHADPVYAGDLHRADMAWAKHAAWRGRTTEEIKDGLLNGRDLSKKDSRKRQLKYAERTARKAIDSDVRLTRCEAVKHGLSRTEIPWPKTSPETVC